MFAHNMRTLKDQFHKISQLTALEYDLCGHCLRPLKSRDWHVYASMSNDVSFAVQRQRLTESTESAKLKFYSRVTGPGGATR